jgi:hypothetical protein
MGDLSDRLTEARAQNPAEVEVAEEGEEAADPAGKKKAHLGRSVTRTLPSDPS